MCKKNFIFVLECEKDQKNTLKYALFSRIFIFRVSHFSCRKKIYQRYCQSMAFTNSLNYSSLVWNTKYCNIIHSLDFISLRVYPPPKFTKARTETQMCIWNSKLSSKWHQQSVFWNRMHILSQVNKKDCFLHYNVKKTRKTLWNVHHLHAFSLFGSYIFFAEKKSVRDIVNVWYQITA